MKRYPSLPEVLELHKQLIDLYGGDHGIRDAGLLESSLMRPQTGYYESLSEEAAALLQSLALNHPFIDGNKRAAIATTAIFLDMNGYTLEFTADEGETFLIKKIIAQKAQLDEISAWLEKYMVQNRS